MIKQFYDDRIGLIEGLADVSAYTKSNSMLKDSLCVNKPLIVDFPIMRDMSRSEALQFALDSCPGALPVVAPQWIRLLPLAVIKVTTLQRCLTFLYQQSGFHYWNYKIFWISEMIFINLYFRTLVLCLFLKVIFLLLWGIL